MATSRIADLVGRVQGGRYRLLRPLGTGASAHVYVAEDVRLRRRVAVKILHPALAADESFLRRFRAEATVVAALRHPHILQVYDWGEDEGAYLVMALLEGGSLRSLLDAGHLLSPAQAIRVGSQAARALEYAHRRGLVHRDIKPANLIFDDEGNVTVADFGLARALAEASWTEPAGAVLGTARYASPEQVHGGPLDGRADVFALALVLIEATIGQVPFAADTTIGTLMARTTQAVTVPDRLGPLAPVLEAAGAMDPLGRLDAGELAGALDRIRGSFPPPAPLELVGPLLTGVPELELVDRTELPRPKTVLFDGESVDRGDRPGAEWVDWPRAEGGDRRGADLTYPPADPVGPVGPAGAVGAGVERGPTNRRRVVASPVIPPPSYSGDPVRYPGEAAGPPPPVRAAGRAPDEGPAGWPGRRPDDIDDTDGFPPVRPRRRWRRRLLVAVLVLVLLAAAAGVVALRWPKPYRTVLTVQGDTVAAADASLQPAQLHVQVAGQAYDPAVPSGLILRQQPAAGGRLREGSAVQVTLSLGPQPVQVPTELVGQPAAVAQGVLAALGLKSSTTTATSPTVKSGDVISATPDHGTLLPGQVVALVVSTGPPVAPVPALSAAPGNQSFAAAQAALTQAGLQAVEDDVYSTTVPKGQVIGTTPPAGQQVPVGSPVTVQISKGPHLVAVPSVRGDSVSHATAVLENAGLVVTGVTGNPTAAVAGTSPRAGALIVLGAAVQIITN